MSMLDVPQTDRRTFLRSVCAISASLAYPSIETMRRTSVRPFDPSCGCGSLGPQTFTACGYVNSPAGTPFWWPKGKP